MTITKDLIEVQSHGVGSGDAAGIIGVSPFKNQTPLQIYMRKRGEIPRMPDTPAMRFGRLVESGIVTAFEEDSGLHVKRFKHPDDLLRHPRHNFMVAMLDGMVTKLPAVVEAKSTANRDEWGEPFSDEVPEVYFCQVQHEIAVSGARGAYVPVIFLRSREITYFYVARDDKFIRNLIECERNFWVNHVLAGKPPKMVNADDAALRYPKEMRGKVKHAGLKLASQVAYLNGLRTKIGKLEDEEEEVSGLLRMALEDTETLAYNGKPIATFKQQVQQRVDIDLLKRRHAAVYRRVLRKSFSRVLRLK